MPTDSLGDRAHYGLAGSTIGIPREFESASEPRPLSSTSRLVSVVSQTGQVGLGGKLVFSIPTQSNACIKSNSMFLRFSAQVTGTNGEFIYFQLPTRDASALFSRLNISYGSQLVDSIQNYNQYASHILQHASSAGFLKNDMRILSFAGQESSAVAANTATFSDCIIPVLSGFFSARSVPLFLMTSPILVEWDIVSTAAEGVFAQAFANAVPGAGTAPTNIQVLVNAQLCYEQIIVDDSYVQSMKSAMKEGALWQSTIQNCLNMQLAHSQSLFYNIGCNISSLRGLLWSIRDANAGTTETPFIQGGTNLARLYLDGRLINQYNLDVASMQYAELQRSLSNLFDVNVTSNLAEYITTRQNVNNAAGGALVIDSWSATREVRNMNRSAYTSRYYLGGINTCRFHDGNLTFVGQPCQQLTFEYGASGTQAGRQLFLYVLYDSLVTLNVDGTLNILK